MRKPKYQFFALEEYQGRLDALRGRMEGRGIDVLLVNSPENLCYVSGYQTPGYYWYQTLIVPMDREPVFVTRLNEASNIEPFSWVEDSRPYEDHEDWIEHTKDALADLGLADVRVGLQYDSFFLTSRDEKKLTAALSEATFVDGSGLVEEGRMVKSEQEIEYIRQAARTAEEGLRAGIEACEVGVTENDVAAEIHWAQIAAGSEYTGLPIFIRTGSRDLMTHSTWYRNVLQPGDSVTIEMPGCINRYHAATYQQIYLGEPPELLLRARETGAKVMADAKSAIRPGVRAGDIHRLVQDSLEEAMGPGSKRNSRAAYSIGIAFAPDWGEGHIISMTEGETRPLQAGMTFHLLAGHVALQGLDGVKRAVNSDTILVTEDGCETLTDGLEHRLWVKLFRRGEIMKFGIMLPHSGALAGVEAIRRVALEADDLGFDSVWCHDHVTYDTDWFLHRGSGLIEQCEGIEPHFYESINTLTWVAGMTQNVKLGTAILVLPLRDPRVLARQAMTLQSLSGGRLMLGVGIGDYPSDFRVMQIPYDEKNRITVEYIDVLNAAFQGGNVDFQGPNISFENASYFPKTEPKVPVLYGGGVIYPRPSRQPKLYEPAIRRIAERCDGWIPEGPPHVMADGIKRIRELAAEAGSGDVDFQVTGYIPLYIDHDSAAQAMTRKTLVTEIHTFEEGLAGSLVGSVGRICKVIESYQEAGVNGLGMRCWAENLPRFVAMMRTFAREVMPRFG